MKKRRTLRFLVSLLVAAPLVQVGVVLMGGEGFLRWTVVILSVLFYLLLIAIMILAFLWPVRGEAQVVQDLDVNSINDKLVLTYKQKSPQNTYAWYYKIGGADETEFTGTLTGENETWLHEGIDIKSEKEITNTDDLDSYPILKLDGLNLTSTTTGLYFVRCNDITYKVSL